MALALLLLGMQHELLVHAFRHVSKFKDAPHTESLRAFSPSVPCLECNVLASVGAVMPVTETVSPQGAGAISTPQPAFVSAHAAAPSYYFSRAPPTIV